MENDIIKLDEEKSEKSAIELISEGYEDIEKIEFASKTSSENTPEEITQRFEGLPAITLISQGLEQIAEDTAKKREAKREFKRKQIEQRESQVDPFEIVHVNETESRWYKGPKQ